MTREQAVKEIVSKCKFYIGIMPQSSAHSFLTRFKAGTAKQKTVESFIKKFGYEIEQPATYKKIKDYE